MRFNDLPLPEVRPGSVLVRVEASVLMTYMKPYVEGKLPIYNAPKSDFTPGGNGVGVVTAVGKDVWHVKRGQRVVISSHVMAGENVEDPVSFWSSLVYSTSPENVRFLTGVQRVTNPIWATLKSGLQV